MNCLKLKLPSAKKSVSSVPFLSTPQAQSKMDENQQNPFIIMTVFDAFLAGSTTCTIYREGIQLNGLIWSSSLIWPFENATSQQFPQFYVLYGFTSSSDHKVPDQLKHAAVQKSQWELGVPGEGIGRGRGCLRVPPTHAMHLNGPVIYRAHLKSLIFCIAVITHLWDEYIAIRLF